MFVKVGEGGNLKSVNGELYAPLQHVSAGSIHIQSLVSCLFTSSDSVLRIRIRIRIHMFLGLLDPDPLVRGMDPDPSIIMQK